MFEQPQSTPSVQSLSQLLPSLADVTNGEFVAAVFRTLPEGAEPVLCSFYGDPQQPGRAWTAQPVERVSDANNNFICTGSFHRKDGTLRATLDQAAAAHFILLDDLGGKIPFERLKGFKLSWLIETSPGNFQGGIIFDKPITKREADALVRAIIDAGLSDPSATGSCTRWGRLPNGVNAKLKHLDADGEPFQCRLKEWRPDARYTPQQIIDGLNLSLTQKPLSERAKAIAPSIIADDRKASFGSTALQNEANAVSATLEGSRNARLFEAGVKCASLAAGGCLDARQAQDTLINAARSAGLTKGEAVATLKSAWKVGAENPRAPQERQLNNPQASKGANMHDTNSSARYVVNDPQQVKTLPKVSLIQASGIALEPINWIWPGYIAPGKFHLLAGSPSAGKTTIAETFAAIISNGGVWPDGSVAEAGNTIVWSGEDDPRDTLVPRLVAAGANLDRIYFIGPVQDGEDKRSFDPAKDIAGLEAVIEEIGGAALLIIDPIIQAVEGDAHRNNETRRALQPIVDLAERTGIAVIGIAHLSKGTQGRDPLERLNGSLAFGALARVVMMAAVETNPKDGEAPKRFFTRAKSNIGPDGGGFEYSVEQTLLETDARISTSRIVFGAALDGTARQILATAEAEEESKGSGALSTAIFFLKSALAHGEVAQTQIQTEAEQHGIAYRTLKRAKKELGIASRKDRFNGNWFWSLTINYEEGHDEEGQNSLTRFLGTLGPLQKNQSLTTPVDLAHFEERQDENTNPDNLDTVTF